MKRLALLLLALTGTAHAQSSPFTGTYPQASQTTVAVSGILGDYTIVTQIRYSDLNADVKLVTSPFSGTYAQCQYAANIATQRFVQFAPSVRSVCIPRHS